MKYLFLASEVRSGSTLGAALIANYYSKTVGSEFFDLTRERFNQISIASTAEDMRQVCDLSHVDRSGIRCSKIMVEQISLARKFAETDPHLEERFFGDETRWIVIRRKNRIRQAVSLAFAKKDGRFHSYDGDSLSDAEEQPSIKDVEASFNSTLRSDIFLDVFSQSLGDRGISFFYEDLVRDVPSFLTQVVEFLGFGPVEKDIMTLKLVNLRVDSNERKEALSQEFATWLLRHTYNASRGRPAPPATAS